MLKVIGHTNNQEVWIVSDHRPFKINEYLVIDDPLHGPTVTEIVETLSLEDSAEKLTVLGAKRDSNTFDIAQYLSRGKIHGDLASPIKISASARLPRFEEIKQLMLKVKPENGLVLGVMTGTEDLYKELPEEYKNRAMLYSKDKGVRDQDGVPMIFDHYKMSEYPHIFLSGTSGSGKSVALRVTMEELMHKEIPNLLGDPHHEFTFDQSFPDIPAHYREHFGDKYVTCTIGVDASLRFEDLTSDELCNALSTAKRLSDTMEGTVKRLHRQGYPLAKFKNDLERLLDAFTDSKNLDQQTQQLYDQFRTSVSGFETLKAVAWRLNAIIKDGLFEDRQNNGIDKVIRGIESRKTVVLRGNRNLLNVFIGYAANNMYRRRRTYIDSLKKGKLFAGVDEVKYFPPFFITLDEAHNFAPRGDEVTPTKTIVREIAQEGRKYGINLILATQRPSLLDSTTTGMINTKIVFRTTRESDIATIREESDLTPNELSRLPFIRSGMAFVSSAIVGRSLSMQFRISKTTSPHDEHPFDELERMCQPMKSKSSEVKKKVLEISSRENGINDNEMQNYLSEIQKIDSTIDYQAFEQLLERMVVDGELVKDETNFLDVKFLVASNKRSA